MTTRYVLGFTLVVLLGVGVLWVSPGLRATEPAPAHDPAVEQLQQIRNLGKAFYENPATQQQAPEELRKAVELKPQSARDRLNYGLALLRAGSVDEGIAEVESARKPDTLVHRVWREVDIKSHRLERCTASNDPKTTSSRLPSRLKNLFR